MKLPLTLLILTLLSLPALAQPSGGLVRLTGVVTDSATGAVLRSTTVRVEGTRAGAYTNADGRYLIRLAPGTHILSYAMVGYRTERRTVAIDSSGTAEVQLDVRLQEAPYQLAEVTVSAEPPGVRMMRRAIRRKVAQSDSLDSYSYTLYTKFIASTDTATAGIASDRADTTIVSIFESYSRGYFRRPDEYFNEIFQRRQTANIPPEANAVAFGTNLSAYDDFVTILGEEIATPFHPSALDYYDFELERSIDQDDSVTVARIRVTPKSDGRKLFSGFVDLDARGFYPRYVELTPNHAVRLPFDASLSWRQTFEEIDGAFVLPASMRIYSSLLAELFWVIAPRIDITIETAAYDYRLNASLDGDLFSQRRVELSDSADTFDSTLWNEHTVMPLRPEELAAYDRIRIQEESPDSLEGSGGIFGKVLGEIPRTIGRLNRRPFSGLDDIFRYNRIAGAYFGLGMIGDVLPDLELAGKIGYGTADKRWYGELGVRGFLDAGRHFSLNGSVYRRLARRDNPYVVGSPAITSLALLRRIDYGDYFYSGGFELGAEAGFGQLRFVRRDQFVRPSTFRIFFRNEDHATATNRATFAIFGGDRLFRSNPPIHDGTLRSFGAELNLGYSPLRRISDYGLQLGAEISDPAIVPSSFRFRQFWGALLFRTRTLPLWRLDLRLGGGWSLGEIPPQRFFSLESAFSAIAPEASFRGMEVKEFYGDRYLSVSLEHNFGEVIPGVFRIPNVAAFGIDFILMGKLGWTQFSKEALAYTGTTLPSSDVTDDRYYYEVGLGVNRLLIFFRFDVTARLSQVAKPKLMFTVSGATN